jgi:cap1 methyltransferase
MAIVKPNTSRPANSERYIVFKSKLDNCESIENFLFKVNCLLDSFETAATQQNHTESDLSSSENVKEDFHYLIPLEQIKEDKEFYDYIYHSNNTMGERQIHFLCKCKIRCRLNLHIEKV